MNLFSLYIVCLYGFLSVCFPGLISSSLVFFHKQTKSLSLIEMFAHIINALLLCLYLFCFIVSERMSMPLSSSTVRRWEESHLWVSHRVLLRYSSQWRRKSGESWSVSLLTLRKSKGLIIIPLVSDLSFCCCLSHACTMLKMRRT